MHIGARDKQALHNEQMAAFARQVQYGAVARMDVRAC